MGLAELVGMLAAGIQASSHIADLIKRMQDEGRTSATADELSLLADVKQRQAAAEARWIALLPPAST